MYVAEPPKIQEIVERIGPERLWEVVHPSMSVGVSAPYVHWDKLRHLEPPEGLTREEWWLALKFGRGPLLRPLPLTDASGEAFSFAVPDEVARLLHFADQRCSGEIAMPKVVTADDQARRHYLVNSLMEEAIRSSQLEGATTSRRVAKDMLRTGRPPKDRSERMIANNYRALQFMREVIGDRLSPATVLELQKILTEHTLDDASAAGRLQTPDDERVAVWDMDDQSLVHRPPPAEQLPNRLAALCDFANGVDDPDRFVHPVLRAIVLHFWLAYDHPFEDGNGRTARALFYWSMSAQGYWLTEYLSISRILRKAPSQYARAFLLTETDDRDVTHFILYQLDVIRRAVEELHTYLERKVKEVREVGALMKSSLAFNHRQLALLGDALRHPDQNYTFRSHASSHNVTHETARLDLLGLHERGLLERRRMRRTHVFGAAPNLSDLLKTIA